MKVKPLQDRVLVLRIEEGNGKFAEDGKRIPLEVKKDDRVLFGKYAGNEIKIDGVEHLIMREDDILAILR
jgi:chaperonin GroES